MWEASSHMHHLMREGCSYIYLPLSMVRYSFILLSALEQCRVKQSAQDFNTAEEDSKSDPLSRESEALPLSHCALLWIYFRSNYNFTKHRLIFIQLSLECRSAKFEVRLQSYNILCCYIYTCSIP